MYASEPELPADLAAELDGLELQVLNIRWLRWTCDYCTNVTGIDGNPVIPIKQWDPDLGQGEYIFVDPRIDGEEDEDDVEEVLRPPESSPVFQWVAEGVFWPHTGELRTWDSEHDARKAGCRARYGNDWWRVPFEEKRARLQAVIVRSVLVE